MCLFLQLAHTYFLTTFFSRGNKVVHRNTVAFGFKRIIHSVGIFLIFWRASSWAWSRMTMVSLASSSTFFLRCFFSLGIASTGSLILTQRPLPGPIILLASVLNRFLELFSLSQLSPNRNKLSCVSCALIILLLEEHRARLTTNISRCSCQTGSSVRFTANEDEKM